MSVEQAIADEVFAKAATQRIVNTNLGGHVQVDATDGYRYTVSIPTGYRASIDWRYGWGGTESVRANATPAQDFVLRAAWAAQDEGK